MAEPTVVVALRWIDARAAVDPLTAAVHARPGRAGAADQCALEQGLRLAEALGARCVAVTVAPAEADGMLREALACGAHAVLRVDGEEDVRLPGSGATVARALAAAVRAEVGEPLLTLTGDRSPDRGTGATPAFLAAEFGCAQALGLLDLAVDTVDTVATGATDAAPRRLTAVRRLDVGRRERLSVPLPAVCSVEPSLRLRRAALPATLSARAASIPVATAHPAPEPVTVRAARPYRPRTREIPAPQGDDPRARLRELTGVSQTNEPPRVVVTDDPAEAADELLAFLRGRGYLE